MAKRPSCARVEAPVLSVGEAPGLCRGLLLILQVPAYRLTWRLVPPGARAAAASAVTVGDNLDPERILALVVRGGAGLAQRIQAVLRRTRGCGGESRQLEDHPRAAIQFRHAEGHGRPFGGHLDLGAGSYVGCPVSGELLAIAAENDWRLSRSSGPPDRPTACAGRPASRTGSRDRQLRQDRQLRRQDRAAPDRQLPPRCGASTWTAAPRPPTDRRRRRPPTVMRPTSPLHTAAFQVGLISQASSTAIASFASLMRM